MERSKIKILLLDDDPFMVRLLEHMLASLGCTDISACESAIDALRRLERPADHPDLILFDLNMPEMDGLEFVRHLVGHQYTGSLILVSGEDERTLQTAETLVRAHKLTVLGRLHKPVAVDSLRAMLDRWAPPVQGRPRSAGRVYSPEDVRAAIAGGQLLNHYQPVVDVCTGEVLGVESLVRWKHPEHGMVFPDQFIGIAEEHGLIDDLTAAVLHSALDQVRQWRGVGVTMRVSINVSMDNLSSLAFPDFVAGAAAQAGIPPDSVVLEVTESRLAKDLRVPLEVLTRLRLKRFGLSIDDFGTGHSSLTQLHDFPFEELKVDRSFVHGANTDHTSRAIYDASLGLARQLALDVVAEGVEDRDDWSFLVSTGCDRAQGYFIARPMPGHELPDWITRWNARVRDEGLATPPT